MNQPYARSFILFTLSLFTSFFTLAQGGGCIPPVASFSSAAGDTARICQGSALQFTGDGSTAAPGHTIVQWIWDRGTYGADTLGNPTSSFAFPIAGVHLVTLEVIDDVGCSSGPSAPIPVLVSATPSTVGTIVPEVACSGDVFQLVAVVEQDPMVGIPVACASANNPVPLVDNFPVTSTSDFVVTDQPNGVITDALQLGDICLDLEHSYMGDLVLSIICPNGQSVVVHQQGGGPTFLGDANDSDGANIVPGGCFQYCFSTTPEYGTLVSAVNVNVVPTSQGTAIAPGRYASVQPLSQLVGCPFNGTWTFSSQDLAGADNGYLCGWCISFGDGPDSSFVDIGPVLGTSPDSSFWSAPTVVNIPGLPGNALYTPQPGNNMLTYTAIDSYGCVHETAFEVSVGAQPEVLINNEPDLGLVCAQVTNGPVSYQWSYQGVPVDGAGGACFTPPGPGLLSVNVANEQGCSDSASLINTGLISETADAPAMRIFPVPNNGTFSIQLIGLSLANAALRIMDMTGRSVHGLSLGRVADGALTNVDMDVAPGTYFVEVSGADQRLVRRIVVK